MGIELDLFSTQFFALKRYLHRLDRDFLSFIKQPSRVIALILLGRIERYECGRLLKIREKYIYKHRSQGRTPDQRKGEVFTVYWTSIALQRNKITWNQQWPWCKVVPRSHDVSLLALSVPIHRPRDQFVKRPLKTWKKRRLIFCVMFSFYTFTLCTLSHMQF